MDLARLWWESKESIGLNAHGALNKLAGILPHKSPKTLYRHRPLPTKPKSPGLMKIIVGRVRYTSQFYSSFV